MSPVILYASNDLETNLFNNCFPKNSFRLQNYLFLIKLYFRINKTNLLQFLLSSIRTSFLEKRKRRSLSPVAKRKNHFPTVICIITVNLFLSSKSIRGEVRSLRISPIRRMVILLSTIYFFKRISVFLLLMFKGKLYLELSRRIFVNSLRRSIIRRVFFLKKDGRRQRMVRCFR